MKSAPIGIFDSGLGGLTALREIRRILPNEDLIYFGDTGRVPYGSRSHETICKYAAQDMRFLLEKAPCKAIVVACGTVSANALPTLRAQFDVPVIGVIEPAVSAAVGKSKNKRIGVIATAATVASHAYEDALTSLCPEIEVISRACPLFVPLVENGFTDPTDPIPRMVAERYLKDIIDAGCDTVILGCTHYPMLAPVISAVLGENVTLIDTGREVAHALRALLKATNTEKTDDAGTLSCFVSDEPHGFAAVAAAFLGVENEAELPSVEKIDIEAY